MATDIVSKKKHKYIDSEEEEEIKPSSFKIDQATYNYLFEPDSSNVQPKVIKKKDPPPIKQQQEPIKPKKVDSRGLEDLRYEILSRWWYCMEEWPPVGYNYAEALAKYKLRQVDVATFKREPELNDAGLRKVYEVHGYKGVFRTAAGDTLDLRPKEGCPSYENMEKMNPKLLPKMYLKGLKAQLKDLQKHEQNNMALEKHLNELIDQSQRQYRKYLE